MAACLAGNAWGQASAPTEPRRRMSAPATLLDDYAIAEPGSFNFTAGAGYTKVPAGFDASLPSFDLSIGLTQRVAVGFSSGFAKSAYDLFRISALGDAYIDAKVVLLRESKRRPGIAFQPVLEILGRPSLAQDSLAPAKVNAAFGGMIGKELWDTVRVYNHSGYFTRGIVFSSAALEVTRFSRFTPSVFAGFGSLTAGRDLAAQQRLNASRLDIGGGLGFNLAKKWSVFGSVGRSLGRRDPNSNTISVSGGISYAWKLWSE